ncbi:hypothetical protein [Bauldia sp.]|uniref:hypothetical protein n=1 Tax=Bauldia sp. TaxID=2575872 RepID=UPI003BA85923
MTVRICLLGLAAVLVSRPALSDDSYPDLRGSWKGTVEAVSVDQGQPAPKPEFGSYTASFEITEQEDRRFAGQYTFEGGGPKWIVGIITDPGRFLWSEPGGIAMGTIEGADAISFCYLRSTEFDQIASCERYQRDN